MPHNFLYYEKIESVCLGTVDIVSKLKMNKIC